MKKAIIFVNPYSNMEAAAYQPRRLKEELELLGVQADIVPNKYRALIEGGEISLRLTPRGMGHPERKRRIPSNEVSGYDFCIYLDKDKYTPRMLEKRGMRLFNCAEAVEVCDDKMLTAIALSDAGIPMPKTFPAPLLYDPNASVLDEAQEIAKILGLPVVVKECYGSLGKQVYLAETVEELAVLCEKLKRKPHLYQQFIAESRGKDLRVICIGGEVVAAMQRTNESDFRSNISLGGKGETVEVGEEVRALCRKVTGLLKLDYCGIDLLHSCHSERSEESPQTKFDFLVCEVNSNAFFGGIEQVTGVNVARCYAEHILKNL